MGRGALLSALIALALGACNLETNEFVCSTDNECPASSGGYGMCVSGHCAFRNGSCPSGWIYDETAGPVANQCVPPGDLVADAGVVPDGGASPDAAAAPDAGAAADAGAGDAGAPDATVADAGPPDA